jgi:hypothetical protein
VVTNSYVSYTTDVSPVTNPTQCRNEPWDKVLTIPSAHAHFKTGFSESRVSQRASIEARVVGERRDDESRESAVNSRAPTSTRAQYKTARESAWYERVNTASARAVCNRTIVIPTSVVGNKRSVND